MKVVSRYNYTDATNGLQIDDSIVILWLFKHIVLPFCFGGEFNEADNDVDVSMKMISIMK